MEIILIIIILLCVYIFIKPEPKKYEPPQEEIQEPTYINIQNSIETFPYPQISTGVKRLSKGELPFPLNNDSQFQPNGERDLKMIRNNNTQLNMSNNRIYLPDYYRKDRLSGNTSGTEELRPFELDNNKSEQSWTDKNVSEHPKFYNSDIKDEINNIGSFFDKNNNYIDKTSVYSNNLTTDKCYKNKKGEHFCEDNTRLQIIPPSLIQNPTTCHAFNSVGVYKDGKLSDNTNDKVMNGGLFFNKVNASQIKNEEYSRPIKKQISDCSF